MPATSGIGDCTFSTGTLPPPTLVLTSGSNWVVAPSFCWRMPADAKLSAERSAVIGSFWLKLSYFRLIHET
jgi:hypothetical protein